jgi:SH3-like domain-containing protein
MEVRVLGCNDDWCKVKRSDGKVGWVKTGTIEIV